MHNPNLQILERAVENLGPLCEEMVFLGGCATGLLLTDVGAPPIRATRDVDVITEVATIAEYHRLSAQLRSRGFKEDQDLNAPICRWVLDNVLLDVMPTKPEVLGFGNEWYQAALQNAVIFNLPSGSRISMVTAPYFLATKLAAFDGRGGGDFLMSHDIEDIVAVLDGRPETVAEIGSADKTLREQLSRRFAALLDHADFLAALPGHLAGDVEGSSRLRIVVDRITEIAES